MKRSMRGLWWLGAAGCSLLCAGCASAPAPAPAPQEPVQLPVGQSLGVAPPVRMALPLAPRLAIGADPVIGAPDAPVTIVEFIDYECPYCQRFAQETFPRLKADYIDTGQVRYVARAFPLPRHPRARPAAIAAACAGEQGRFWEMHAALLGAAGQLRDADFRRHADRLGLDRARFEACLGETRHEARLTADFQAARAVGVGGTPSFLVGASHGEVAQGRLLQGDEDYAAFERVIEGTGDGSL